MKLTWEPTTDQTMTEHPQRTVSISIPSDHVTLQQLNEVFESLALALGYHPGSVAELLGGEG